MRRILIALALVSVSSAPALAQAPAQPPAQTPAQPPAQTAAQHFRLAAATLQLSPGETSAALDVTVTASFQEAEIKPVAEATLTDVTPSTAGVTVVAKPVKPTSDLTQAWTFPVTVKGLQRAESQSRVFLVSYGALRETLAYTLSNTTTRQFAWAVKAAPEWNLASMTGLSVAVTVADVPATNVRLQQAALSGDDKLKRTLGTEHFELCQDAQGRCVPPPASLVPRQPYTVYVRPTRVLPVGVFKGNILIAAAEKTDPEVLNVTLYSPHPRGVLYGFIALTIGVLVSLLLQVFARGWVEQRHDKLAIAMLRKRLTQVVDDFGKLPKNLQDAAIAWRRRATQLATEMLELDGLARSAVPQPFADEVVAVETLKAALERHGKSVSLLRTLHQDGLVLVSSILEGNPAVVTEAETAAEEIASISAAENAATLISASLATLRKAAQVTTPPLLASAGGRRTDSVSSLRLQVTAASTVVWIVWALISVLSGALLLIYQNPAFGTQVDLLTCLAWGLGVSIAGQQATQLNPTGVAQSIGVKLPGSK